MSLLQGADPFGGTQGGGGQGKPGGPKGAQREPKGAFGALGGMGPWGPLGLFRSYSEWKAISSGPLIALGKERSFRGGVKLFPLPEMVQYDPIWYQN